MQIFDYCLVFVKALHLEDETNKLN